MKKGKKLTSEILSIRNDSGPGGEVFGIFEGVTPLVKQSGEAVTGGYGQELFTLELTDPGTGEVKKYWADGGIRGALKMAKVNKGMAIFITHTGDAVMTNDDGTKGKIQTYEIHMATE